MDNVYISRLLENWDNRSPKSWHEPINKVIGALRFNAQLVPRSFTWGLANVEARMNLFHLVSQCAAFKVPGQYVELGCNAGESSIVIQKILLDMAPDRQLFCYDSFEGLPELDEGDSNSRIYVKGEMSASLAAFHNNFRKAGVAAPSHVTKGWFKETIPIHLPDRIAFAFIDVDLYASTKDVLPHIYSRLTPGGICMFGVYYDAERYCKLGTIDSYKSPGVKLAADEFLRDKPEKISVLYANEYSNGYFRKS